MSSFRLEAHFLALLFFLQPFGGKWSHIYIGMILIMKRDKLALYLYEKYRVLVTKEVYDYSEENLDRCLDKQVLWDGRKHDNTSVLRREQTG